MQQRFLEAQQRYLDHHRVDASSTFVATPITGGSAHVLTAGEGAPAVMLNGIGTPAAMWAPLMGRLRGARVHAVDLPGYGLSDFTPALTSDLKTSAVRFIDEVFAGLELSRAALIGNSLGSLWSMWFTLSHPDKVTHAAHIGCPALVLGTSAPLPMRLLSTPMLGRLMTTIQPPSRAQVRQLARMVGQHPLEDELAALLLETERLPQFREALLSMLRVLISLRGPRPDKVLTPEDLAGIRPPTLIVWGENDPFGDVGVGRRMAECVPNAQTHVVPGGHAPWLTEPQQTAELVSRFLGLQAA